MKLKFQCDADFKRKIIEGLVRVDPMIDIQTADEAGLRGAHDSRVLAVSARQDRVLLTHDRRTMPYHFARFIQTHESAGVIVIAQNVAVRTAIEEIYLIWAVESPEAWRNRISDVPV